MRMPLLGRAHVGARMGARMSDDRQHVGAQRGKIGGICIAPRTNRDIGWRCAAERGQQLDARQLFQATLQSIAIDRRVLMTGHNDSNP